MQVLPCRAGYRRQVDGDWHYFVLPQSFKLDLCDGFDVQVATAILLEKEWLIPDSEGKSTRVENLPCSQSTTRCYRIDGNKVFADEI
jgi:putative DNA primase/helicase